ncbi:1,6-dihydroxycyclohexa-2,4-diene-1-carboxylate dehydrogenase [Cupriavidus sp. 2KB_3]|uniref:1,6-dihydroxycyclohexa-2,4-diene-1-carboxylate dehydrogenase n=1 Tax=Cupriavidus TaxID=106589 RepID=UPI0011ECC300|nr:1,6-dihydroxycyclohexa-2,4-diene-1-carboxylate dehydrogenase [Cupriavidus campinensis]
MRRAQRFAGRTMLVTGAAQGIGRGVALAAAAEGARVMLADRAPLVEEVVAEIAAQGGTARAVLADLERYAGAQAMVAATRAAFGPVDILINNVGGTIWAKPYEHYAEDEIEAEIRRSLFPTLWGCRAVLPDMVARQAGVIVNVSSIATRSIHRVPYAAAKGGVNALTASLAFEHAADGIRVNAVATGGTEAPPRKIPRNAAPQSAQEAAWYQAIVDQTRTSSLMQRYGTIDEQVAVILFLASEESSYMTGTVVPVGGGDLG